MLDLQATAFRPEGYSGMVGTGPSPGTIATPAASAQPSLYLAALVGVIIFFVAFR